MLTYLNMSFEVVFSLAKKPKVSYNNDRNYILFERKIMNLIKKIIAPIIIACILLIFSACTSAKVVSRTSADTITDLSGRWNDTDSRLVAEQMITDMLGRPWLEQFNSANQKPPVIIAGYVKNRSSEHIEVSGIIADIERELINSSKATVVASSAERTQIREERLDQQDEASFETIKRLGEETGADYMLIGTIISQTDAAGDTTAVTYQVDLELIHIENTQKVWIGNKKIKKIIER